MLEERSEQEIEDGIILVEEKEALMTKVLANQEEELMTKVLAIEEESKGKEKEALMTKVLANQTEAESEGIQQKVKEAADLKEL